jgi:hypothetical protein
MAGWTWSGKGYPSPSQVQPAQNARQKQLADAAKQATINTYRQQIEGFRNDIKKQQAIIKVQEENVKRYSDIINTSTNQVEINAAITGRNETRQLITAANNKIISLNKSITNTQNTIKKLTNKKPVVNNKPTTTSATTQVTDSGGKVDVEFSADYKYNAPLVSSMYFNKGISADSLGGTLDTEGFPINAPVFSDAYNAWRGVNGGRGTIQMDRKYVNLIGKTSNGTTTKLDPQMYGFKFLYNPTTVSMAWGVQSMMDPNFESSGEDVFNPISAGLISSTIVFEVLLNRIADFNHLNADGSIRGKYPYGEIDVPIADRKQIYNRGTMYDLEYFFRTINGPHGTFTSAYNGLTADSGWLRPSSMELHLGAGMRYRIRINEVSINHAIFNNRMVPILSTVRFVCGRYNDGPGTPLLQPASVNTTTLEGIRAASGGFNQP